MRMGENNRSGKAPSVNLRREADSGCWREDGSQISGRKGGGETEIVVLNETQSGDDHPAIMAGECRRSCESVAPFFFQNVKKGKQTEEYEDNCRAAKSLGS